MKPVGAMFRVGVLASVAGFLGGGLTVSPLPASAARVSAVGVQPGVALGGEPARLIGDIPVQAGPAVVAGGAAPVFAPTPPVGSLVPGVAPGVVRPVADVSKLVEIPSLRTATRNVFRRSDGLQEVHESSVPVNFQDPKGVWVPVDNHLVSDGAGGFVNVANSFRVSFKAMRAGGGVSISAADGLVSFVANGADAAVLPVLSTDGLTVTYTNVVAGSDLVYSVTGAGVEENLIVKSALSTPSVAFTVTGAGLAKDLPGLRGGGVGLASRLRVSNPDTFDAHGHVVSAAVQVFEAIDAATGAAVPDVVVAGSASKTLSGLSVTDGPLASSAVGSLTSVVTVGVDAAWVKTQPVDVFPVTVDPSVIVLNQDNLVSYAVHTNTGVAYASYADGYARVGNPGIGGGNADVAWRTVVHFPFESYIGATSVDNAFLSTTVVAESSAGPHPLNMYWASQFGWHYGTTPINGWGSTVSAAINTGNEWLGANGSGSELRSFYNGFVVNNNPGAALLLTSTETGYTLKKFSVQLVLVVNQWPLASVLALPASGGSNHNATQTLSATIPQQFDADGDQVYYQYFYCKDSSCSAKIWPGAAWSTVTSANMSTSQSMTFAVTSPFSSQDFWWGVATYDANAYPSLASPSIQFGGVRKFTVTNQVPVATLVSPVDGTVLSSTQPTLTAIVSDPDDPTVNYRFVVTPASGSGILSASPWSSTPVGSGSQVSWTIPVGLMSGAGYSWHVEVKDLTSLAGTSPIWSLTSQGRLGADSSSPMQPVGVGQVNLATGNLFFAGGGGRSISTVGGNVGVGMSYNSQDMSAFGLLGQYGPDTNANGVLDSSEVSLTRIDPVVSFNWGLLSPGGAVPVDNFVAKWSGYMRLPQLSGGSGTHVWRFAGGHDDTETITVTRAGGAAQTVFVGTSWIGLGDPTVFTTVPTGTPTPITLNDGELVKVQIDFKDTGGAAAVEFRAQSDGTTEQQVTTKWFSTAAPSLPAGWTLSTDNGLQGAWAKVAVQTNGVYATGVDGSMDFFAKSVTNGIASWTAPAGNDDLLVVNGDNTVTIHGADGLVYRFDNTGAFVSVDSAPDDLKPAGADASLSNASVTGAPFKTVALTDRLAASRSIKLWYQQTGLTPTGGCPVLSGFAPPPDGMLCRIDYPDGTQTRLYYQNGLLARISNPGDETVAGSATLPAPEGRSVTDLGFDANGNLITVMSPSANDRVAAEVASASLAQIPAADLAMNVTWTTTKVATVTLPRPTLGQARPVTTLTYGATSYATGGTTTVQASGITGNARSVGFDSAGRLISDTDAVGRVTTTQWSPAADVVLWSTGGGRTSSTVYDQWWHPTDAYGPVPTACYGTLPTSITESTNGPVPATANAGCASVGISQIPHTHTDYDTGLAGMTTAVWPNTSWAGKTSAHHMAPDYANGIQYNETISPAAWSARYTGLVFPPAAGSYTLTFYTGSATSATLFINDAAQASETGNAGTTITFTVADTKPWRVRLDTSTTSTTENVSLFWTTPLSSTATQIPNSVIKPGFWYPTQTTTDDTTGSTQVPAKAVTATRYTDAGMDPSYGIATSTIVDPTGAALQTVTAYETPESGSLLRRTTRTLPAYTGAGAVTSANSTTSTYYGSGVTAANPCAAGSTPADQGQMAQVTVSATPASGVPVKTEQVYDILGRVVASRYWNGATAETAWTCSTFDARGRVTQMVFPAYGTTVARTVTTTYRAPYTTGGTDYDPFTTVVMDTAGPNWTMISTVDALGRSVSSKDVWGKTTTNVYDTAGRVTSSTGPAGVTAYSYDNAGRVTQQSLDANVIATPTYSADTATLDPGALQTVTYPSGAGNGGNNTNGAVTYDPYGRVSGIVWKQSASTLITSDAVTRSLTGRVLNDYVDGAGTPSWVYQYDTAGRLIRATGSSHDYQYGYANTSCSGTNNNLAAGLNGNRTSVRDNGVTTQTACFDQADRLTSYGTPTVAYATRLNVPTTPNVYWKLGDTTGTTTVATNGGATMNGTYSATGVILNQVGAPTGVTNPAAAFAGGNVQIPVSAVTGSGKTFTLWFKTASSGILMSKNLNASGGANTSYNPFLYVGTDGKLRGEVFGAPIAPITTGQAVNDNKWHHVILAVAATTQTLYLDGVKVGTKTGSSVNDTWGPAYAYIGTGAASSAYWPGTTGTWMPFNGSIDEVAIYNTVFTDANVAAQDNPAPAAGLVTPTYDYRGNMTGLNGDTYTYDSAGRHLSTVHGTTTVTYMRDATNAVVARTDSATGVTTRYSGDAVLDTSSTVIERTMTLPGGVLVTKRTAGDVWSYPNIHGDVVATANATGVKQGTTLAYDPYGNAATLPDNSNGNWDYGWVGNNSKGTEHATGLVVNIEMGARIYNPVLGRFLSVDPIEGGTTTNDYGYVGDVVNQFDLTGECGTWGNPFKKCGKGHKGSVGFLGGKFSEAGRWVKENRRVILAALTTIASVACIGVAIAGTGGLAAPLCMYTGVALSAATVAQSYQDNMTQKKRCPFNFGYDAVVGLGSIGLNFSFFTPETSRIVSGSSSALGLFAVPSLLRPCS